MASAPIVINLPLIRLLRSHLLPQGEKVQDTPRLSSLTLRNLYRLAGDAICFLRAKLHNRIGNFTRLDQSSAGIDVSENFSRLGFRASGLLHDARDAFFEHRRCSVSGTDGVDRDAGAGGLRGESARQTNGAMFCR